MKLRVVSAKELSQSETELWSLIQDRNPSLRSPFFSPQFTQAVARVRDDAFVAIVEEANKVVAFFPFQKSPRGIGKPIGWPLCDYQGLVAAPESEIDVVELVSKSGLKVFDFDHLLMAQGCFHPFHTRTRLSPQLDLSLGFDHYVKERARAGSRAVQRLARNRKKLENRTGSLRFVLHDTSQEAFHSLLRWKGEQYRRTRAFDLFELKWIVSLLDDIRAIEGEAFAGLFSTLYSEDRLVAVHLGMRSRYEWHYWFPTFNNEFHAYSPGLVLLVDMTKKAESIGLKSIDLGAGQDSYKARLATGAVPIAVGFVGPPSLAIMRRSLWHSIGRSLTRLPAQSPFEHLRRAYRRIDNLYQTPK